MVYFLGIDIGCVSVKAAVVDGRKKIVEEHYLRIKGEPGRAAGQLLEEIGSRFKIESVFTTGAGGKLVPGRFVNEIIAQSSAMAVLYPAVRTVIEIGGENSRLLRIEKGKLADFSSNNVCAAGTGSFLDQQAARLGYTIEEFSALALKSKRPPRIAGRCTVFAKSDMIHLQQKGTPDHEIIAGLCLAVARNFTGSLGRKIKIEKPVAFLGGVAANAGMVQAFETLLSLPPGGLLVPPHFATMGAAGAAIHHLK